MEYNYITFHKIITLLQEFQEGNPMINSFGYGNLVDFGKNVSGSTVVYPFLFVVPLSITYDENTTTYQVTLIFADRLNDNLDNEVDCISDSSLNARNFLSQIKRGNLGDYFDVTLPQQAQPFLERFNDNVAGVALDANIVVFEDINACPPYPTPTPSSTPNNPTPSVTPTSTVTPTVTGTPNVTPTNTATATNTPTVTSTPTNTPSGGLPPGVYAFAVSTGSTQGNACININIDVVLYGNKQFWFDYNPTDTLYLNPSLTTPGGTYYAKYAPTNSTWNLVNGMPQSAGYQSC